MVGGSVEQSVPNGHVVGSVVGGSVDAGGRVVVDVVDVGALVVVVVDGQSLLSESESESHISSHGLKCNSFKSGAQHM